MFLFRFAVIFLVYSAGPVVYGAEWIKECIGCRIPGRRIIPIISDSVVECLANCDSRYLCDKVQFRTGPFQSQCSIILENPDLFPRRMLSQVPMLSSVQDTDTMIQDSFWDVYHKVDKSDGKTLQWKHFCPTCTFPYNDDKRKMTKVILKLPDCMDMARDASAMVIEFVIKGTTPTSDGIPICTIKWGGKKTDKKSDPDAQVYILTEE